MRPDESLAEPVHVFYSYAQEDEVLVKELEKHFSTLKQQGYITAWDKRNISAGREWLYEINKNLNTADIILLIISADCLASNYSNGIEMQRALARHEAKEARVIPIILRPVDWKGAPFSHLQALPTGARPVTGREWHNQDEALADIAQGIREVVEELQAMQTKFKPEPMLRATDGNIVYTTPTLVSPLPTFDPQWLKELDASGGAVPLDSQFYVERQADAEAKEQLLRAGVTIRIKGSRQMGKTSLLARLLQHANEYNYPFIYIDFQELENHHLNSLDALLYYFAYRIAVEQQTNQSQDHYWQGPMKLIGSKEKLTSFLSKEVLEHLTHPFILFLDEVDHLFSCNNWHNDFFSLVRSWHNKRAMPHFQAWKKLNIVLTYSTEASFFITDLNQSPFNVGTHFSLADFDRTQVEQLNYKHGSPVKTAQEMDSIMRLLQGHPFLVRKALYALAVQELTIEELLKVACDDNGPFSEHLRLYLLQFDKNQQQRMAMKSVIQNQRCPNNHLFYQLRSSGLVIGPSYTNVQPRCELYRQYFQIHL